MKNLNNMTINFIGQSFNAPTGFYSLTMTTEGLYVIKKNDRIMLLCSTPEDGEGRFATIKKQIMRGGDYMTDAQKKFQEAGQAIKAEVAQEEEEKQQGLQEVKNHLASLKENPELAQMYRDSANLGADNLGGESPLLKIHVTNKSEGHELADGGEPNNGWFFYKPTAEQFQSVKVHILTVSRGFKSKGKPDKDGKVKEIFNQIVGGVIAEDEALKPFLMYFTGLKLSRLWDFGKEARKYTRSKVAPIPMFTLTIELSTLQVDSSFGKQWVVDFDILKNEDNSPVIVLDPGKAMFLRDNVEDLENNIEGLISKKQSEEVVPTPSQAIAAEEVNPADVPF